MLIAVWLICSKARFFVNLLKHCWTLIKHYCAFVCFRHVINPILAGYSTNAFYNGEGGGKNVTKNHGNTKFGMQVFIKVFWKNWFWAGDDIHVASRPYFK